MDTPAAQANISSLRGPFYKRAYQQVMDSLADEGALRGEPFMYALTRGHLLLKCASGLTDAWKGLCCILTHLYAATS